MKLSAACTINRVLGEREGEWVSYHTLVGVCVEAGHDYRESYIAVTRAALWDHVSIKWIKNQSFLSQPIVCDLKDLISTPPPVPDKSCRPTFRPPCRRKPAIEINETVTGSMEVEIA